MADEASDIRERAREIAVTWVKWTAEAQNSAIEAILALVLRAKEEQREQDAKIAYAHIEPTSFGHPARVEINAANTMAKKIAAAIRQGT